MTIGERATVLTHRFSREVVAVGAANALQRVAATQCEELIVGEDVAWILAAAMLPAAMNGSPKIITRTLDDGIDVTERIG